MSQSRRIQVQLAFTFGVIFVSLLVVLAVLFPHPSPFQYEVFRIVLALAAAGTGGVLPGVLMLRYKPFFRASGALALFAIVYFYNPARLVTDAPDSKTRHVSVFDGAVHLGDNTFARIGGLSLPSHDSPTENDKDVIYYDKSDGTFFTRFGSPTGVQLVASLYGPRLKTFNLAAWKDIAAMSRAHWKGDWYEGQSVQIDGSTLLVWQESAGNFYARTAAVARVTSLNLYKQLLADGKLVKAKRIRKATMRLEGFHGGKRRGQPDNLDLLIDQNRYAVRFASMEARTEEVIEVPIDVTQLSLDPARVHIFALIVLPMAEDKPLPPVGKAQSRSGPAHFRDVEIGRVVLTLEVE